jgi:hypothetical protein
MGLVPYIPLSNLNNFDAWHSWSRHGNREQNLEHNRPISKFVFKRSSTHCLVFAKISHARGP